MKKIVKYSISFFLILIYSHLSFSQNGEIEGNLALTNYLGSALFFNGKDKSVFLTDPHVLETKLSIGYQQGFNFGPLFRPEESDLISESNSNFLKLVTVKP